MAIPKIIKTEMPEEEPEEIEERFEELKLKRVRPKWLIVVAIIIIILVLIWVLYYFDVIPLGLFPHKSYQAVFLTNGQVYFGKLYHQNSRYPVLREIYYLQVTQPPQPLQEGQTPPANINLVKLGGELHGPTDEMKINRDQILFVEDLKSDSRVVQAIQQFQPPK